MVQNLKIDIIYYNTPSDFEFEFNLGGCCHSRILNNRTSSPKEILEGLSKAVSRSRVIFIIGKIGDADGLMSLISQAVGIPLVMADSEEFGISSPSELMVLKNALPLVSKDGILSGCIVESGPQSIIILSENKSMRKDVSENLVFPYITAMSRTPETDNVLPDSVTSDAQISEETETQPAKEETQSEEATDISEEDEAVTEEAILEPSEQEPEIEEINEYQNDDSNDTPQESDDSILFTKSKEEIDDTIYDNPPEMDENYVLSSDLHLPTLDEDEDEYETEKNRKKAKKPLSGITIAILIICGFLLIIAAILLYMLVYQPSSSSIPVLEYIKEVFYFS